MSSADDSSRFLAGKSLLNNMFALLKVPGKKSKKNPKSFGGKHFVRPEVCKETNFEKKTKSFGGKIIPWKKSLRFLYGVRC